MQDHVDAFGKPGDGLVYTIVDDFLGQMVGTLGIGIHSRSSPDRVKPLEHFQRGGVIVSFIGTVAIE